MSSRSPSSLKYRYLRCFGPGLLQNIAIYMLLGGQCSQTPLFTQHLPSHIGVAVSVVEIRLQPKASLFTLFWARAAPKHRYLPAFGRPVLPNTIIYAPFALSFWWGCEPRRDPGPAKSIAIYGVLGYCKAASKHRYLHAFGRPVLPNTMIYTPCAFSY